MALGFILLGLLLVLPGSLQESVNSYRTDEEYAELIRKIRYLAAKHSDNLLEQRYKQRHYNTFPDWKEVVDEDKRFQSIEKAVIDDNGVLIKDTVETTSPSDIKSTKSNSSLAAHPSAPLPLVDNNSKQDKTIAGVAQYDFLFIGIVAACSLAGFIGLIMAGVCWYKLNKNIKAASEVDYPAYGVTGPTKERLGSGPGDRKLAQSAQMYHYQHQKQQMIAMEKANGEMKHDASEDESEEENEEGDYTVYECPGLAPTGEMEVRNPLFNEETPVSQGPPDDHKDVQ